MMPFQEKNTTHFQCHKVNTWQLCMRKLFYSVEGTQNAMKTRAGIWQSDTGMWERWGGQSLQKPESSVLSQSFHEAGPTQKHDGSKQIPKPAVLG